MRLIFFKILKIKFLLFALFFLLPSCTEDKSNLHYRELEDIKRRGKIVAITDYNSTNYFIYRGTPMGYQYEMLKLLAKHLDVDLEIKVSNKLSDNFECLNNGECDIIALNLTVTKERSKKIAFTAPVLQTYQVLVQRKPDNWQQLTQQEINLQVIRNQLNLAGKTIYVQENSAHAERLMNLSEEIGDTINIVALPMTVEELIKLVAEGKIEYTVCDENVAKVNQTYYPNIDIQTAISFPQHITWAVHTEAKELRNEINKWLKEFGKTLRYQLLYSKYFVDRKSSIHIFSEYYTFHTGKLSPYDEYIKKYSKIIGWDWCLLASLIYQESRFNPNVKSWAGAFGLMQLMPITAERYGVTIKSSPEQQIHAGVQFIKWLDDKLAPMVTNDVERLKFVLASYNVGLGHIFDARRLAQKNGKNPNLWDDNVDYFLLNKSKPGYYTDPEVQYGYCRGEEPYYYVKEILERFVHYRNIINNSNIIEK